MYCVDKTQFNLLGFHLELSNDVFCNIMSINYLKFSQKIWMRVISILDI